MSGIGSDDGYCRQNHRGVRSRKNRSAQNTGRDQLNNHGQNNFERCHGLIIKWLKPGGQSDPHLNRFNRVINVLECRLGSRRHPRGVGIINVMVLAVEQV